MSWVRHKSIIIVAAVVVLAGLVAGALLALRGGGQARRVAATPPHSQQLRSPFTGEPVPSLNRVLAVKIDNIVFARPQTGLTHADIVYVLPVEGGLSRFLAVFSSALPAGDRAGAQRARGRPAGAAPVRAARVRLLRCHGRAAALHPPDRPDRGPVRGHHPRATTATTAGSPPTTCTPTPRCCWRRRAARARHATSGSGSARHHRAGSPSGRRRWPTRPPRSASPGRRRREAGWCRWTAPRRSPPTAGGWHRPPW